MTNELDELSKVRAMKEAEKLFKRYGINKDGDIHSQLSAALSNGRCCSGRCSGHSVGESKKDVDNTE